MFCLIDANNFYASCERVFNPKLHQQPVIVLSNNDGCVIARSDESKQLGISMGTPYFKIKEFCAKHRVHVYSSNYALYGDMSNRVISLIKSYEPQVEVYSIDEVFVFLKGVSHINLKQYLLNLRQTILKATGIPVSIGVGATKTLAKIGSFQAKKILKYPVCIIGQCVTLEQALHTTPVSEIWGIGRSWAKQFEQLNILTALDLSLLSANVIRRQYNVVLADTVRELQGQACLKLEMMTSAKKNIMSSKSFGNAIRTYQAIAEALSDYAARAAEKLRAQHSVATDITVFLQTNRFNNNNSFYNRSIQLHLPVASNDTGLIIQTAKIGLRQIFKSGLQYHKTGILLGGLLPDTAPQQLDLFDNAVEKQLQQKKSVSLAAKTMDIINQRFGKETVFLACQKNHTTENWHLRANFKSPCYTTRWSDIVRVRS